MKTLLNALRSSSYTSTPSTKPSKSSSMLNGRPTQISHSPTYVRSLFSSPTSPCTCPDHSADHYYSYPLSCTIEHLPSNLPIQPHRRPIVVDPDAENHPYNALFLARSAVRYFTRAEEEMDKSQRGGLTMFRSMVRGRDGLMDRLNVEDCRQSVDTGYMLELCRCLCEVFFFGEDVVGDFKWEENVNAKGRGRAWHMIAKAIEEVGPGLLGVREIGLRRLACLVADVEDGVEKPSRHDLQVYGFAGMPDAAEVGDSVEDDEWVMVERPE
ncbi:hypothetical protein CC80DRAFT_88538 [Byssothecium circinans]|uniref:Uncharacterized protein n=1 Tax=Byssothecium circinans TaxID=147558 RepID=A0A6A5TT41_9PLEO|nr:hypothetical protein CC80DRAFT_88538 [Byssothecium circinans]